jgi:ATP-binding cassette subfamily C (CFTR/MRP) protein 1
MLFGDIVFFKMVMKSSRYLHDSMFASILRSTMTFFESTPIGRIINRFSKDIEAVEFTIPTSYRMLLRMLFQVLITIIMISISTPYFLLPLIPIAVIYVYAQVRYIYIFLLLLRNKK